MKRNRTTTILVTAAFALGCLPVGAAAGKTRRNGTNVGVLRLLCEVDGARYVIDEDRGAAVRGTTPAGDIELEPGPHTIRVTREGFLPFSEVFDIVPGEVTELEVDLVLYSGTLHVQSVPVAARVQVDGREVGKAPVEVTLTTGEHVVRLTSPGFVEEARRVSIKTGRRTELAVRLSQATVQEAAGDEQVPVYEKWWFWTSIGVAVAAAAVVPTVILLKRGDRVFEGDAEADLGAFGW